VSLYFILLFKLAKACVYKMAKVDTSTRAALDWISLFCSFYKNTFCSCHWADNSWKVSL